VSSVGSKAGVERDIAVDALAFDIVGIAHDGGFCDQRVGDQSALNLRRAQTVAGDVQDIVHPSGDPPIAVRIPPGAVAGEIKAAIGGEIRLRKALMVAINRAHLTGPAAFDDQIAFRCALVGDRIAFIVHQSRLDAEHGEAGRARLERMGAGQRRHQAGAGFGLPPGVDDGEFPLPTTR
jgi:hypothetical protein